MSSSTDSRVAFGDSETRTEKMHRTIEAWIDDLVALTDEARTSQQFQEWLDIQSRFHDYSHRNTLLIKLQCPDATKVAGYNTWRSEFDRHVQEGEQAIWIWAPIIAQQCPECENSPSYHDNSECEYDETPPEEWSNGLVGCCHGRWRSCRFPASERRPRYLSLLSSIHQVRSPHRSCPAASRSERR